MWSSYFFQDCSHLKTMKDKVSYFIVLFYHFQVLAAFTVFWDLRAKSNGCHKEEDLLKWDSLFLAFSLSWWCCRALQQNPDTCLQMNISSQLKKAASKRTCFKNLLNRLTCDMSYNEVRLHFSRQCALCTRDQRGCLERNHEGPALL